MINILLCPSLSFFHSIIRQSIVNIFIYLFVAHIRMRKRFHNNTSMILLYIYSYNIVYDWKRKTNEITISMVMLKTDILALLQNSNDVPAAPVHWHWHDSPLMRVDFLISDLSFISNHPNVMP